MDATAEPRPVKGGSTRSFQMGMRVTREMRQAVEAEAERTGRTKSQVVEHWLEQAREQNALYGLRDLREVIVRLLWLVERNHESMCPANTCTCRKRGTIEAQVAAVRVVLDRLPG